MKSKEFRVITLIAGVLCAMAACGGEGAAPKPEGGALNGVEIEVAAKWTGTEQKNFLQVVKKFEERTGATVKYASTGENTDAYLGPRLQGGNPPDIAILPQPGLLRQYAERDALKPLASTITQTIDQNYMPYWKELGSVDGRVYGVLIKAAYKSTIWYRTDAFDEAGVKPPATWAELVGTTAATLSEAGTKPFVMCGASGWTLTDWFENVYLSQAGPQMYDKLAKHEIKWTHPSVGATLRTLDQLWGEPSNLADGKMQTDYPSCVTKVFGQREGAMVYEGDFAATDIAATNATVGEQAKAFPFPSVGSTRPVTLGGDLAVVMKDGKGAQELLKYLASTEAGATWAKLGGFFSPNKNLKRDAYPDEVHRLLADTILQVGDNARYDLSDLTPSAFGATEGKGMWLHLQNFLNRTTDVAGTQAKLEADAAAAYK
jgi:alpha-glucoside transport system substrate-binding protein